MRDLEVAGMGRFMKALEENHDRKYRVLQEAIEYLEKRSTLLEVRERKQKLLNGAPGRNLEDSFSGCHGRGKQDLGGGN